MVGKTEEQLTTEGVPYEVGRASETTPMALRLQRGVRRSARSK
jgi:hypothetical protein